MYDGDRLEIVMQFPNQVDGLSIEDLVLNNDTHIQIELSVRDCTQISENDIRRSWDNMNRDVLFTSKDLAGGYDDCYVAVGSRWKPDIAKQMALNDPYLLSHVSLFADGIEMIGDGDAYVFSATGEGKVSLCLFDIPVRSGKVRVLEKSEIKRKMLFSIPINCLITSLYVTRWLGPIGFAVSLPVATVYTIVAYVRVILA